MIKVCSYAVNCFHCIGFIFIMLKKFYKTITIIAILLSLLLSVTVSFADEVQYSSELNATLTRLESSQPQFGSIGGEWKVFALARSGRIDKDSKFVSDYLISIEDMLKSNGDPKLDPRKPSENSRLVIALSSLGYDAADVAGFDLTQPLKEIDFVRKQGITGVIYALIALDCKSEYATTAYKKQLVDFIVNAEINGGGWAMGGTTPDPDITAAAICAIANYSSAKTAVNRGIDVLSDIQCDNGEFQSYGNINSESCSQVLVALSTVGIDASSDSRFIKNGCSLLDALLSFFTGDGFTHLSGGSTNQMASEQAAYALCAYDRMIKHKNDLYDMSDVWSTSLPTPVPTQTPKPTATPTPQPTATVSPTETTQVVSNTVKPSQTPIIDSTPMPEPTSEYEAETFECITEIFVGNEETASMTAETDTAVPNINPTGEPINEKNANTKWLLPLCVAAAVLVGVSIVVSIRRKS